MPIIVDLTGPPGTGLDLSAIWLNTATDPSDVRSFNSIGEGLSASTKARGEVRQLANRRRLIVQGSGGALDLSESMQVTLVRCDREEVAWLKARTGVLMCVRDHVGTKFYGTWLEAPRQVDSRYRDRIDVSLTIDQVTHSEAT